MMTPERWQRVKELLGPALELDVDKRADYLDQACGSDPTLRPDLEHLLAAGQKAGADFLNDPVIPNEFVPELPRPDDHWIGRRLGPYQIVEEIGTGGMGEVYRGVRADDEYRKEVAIKLVRSGQDSGFVLNRFKNERQILASLDHPNIARLLDGGTTEEGLPYFVMELIEGQRVDEYCDEHKLATSERLKLFLQVCSAVQYAHQHLVIHRDIKPGNILVTANGVPKLLDFGIAKILEASETADQPEQTISLVHLLTPAYASPEQVKGESITTGSDVYSLGVVLYELLTGRIPYDVPTHTPHEISRAVCETEPERPSTAARRKRIATEDGEGKQRDAETLSALREGSPEKLSKRLSGDLDNILLMALRKEPHRRYSSVEQFAQDIRRHLERLPVFARKDTFGYWAWKFIARHKAGVSAATLVTIALLTATSVTIREARIARTNQLRAERRLQQTRELTESLIGDLANATGNGAAPAKVLMNRKGVEYLQQLAQEESRDPKLTYALGLGYLRLGEALGNPGLDNMGDLNGALENYQRAIVILQKQLSADPGNTRLRLNLLDAYRQKGLALGWTDVLAGLQMHRNALAVLSPETPDRDFLATDARGWEYEIIGGAYGDPHFPNLGDTSRAIENARMAMSLGEKWYRTDPKSNNAIHLYYACNVEMADLLWARGRTGEALKYQELGEAVLHSNSSSSQPEGDLLKDWAPQSQIVREERAMAMIRRANLLAEAGRESEAQAVLRESRGMLETLFSIDPGNYGLRRDLTRNYNLTGFLLTRTGKFPAALDMYRKALPLTTEVLRVQMSQPDVRQHLADTYEGIANTLAAVGKTSEALENGLNALAIREALAKLDPNDARYQFSLAKNDVSVGNIMAKTHDRARAIDYYHRAVAIEDSLAAKDPFNALVARDLVDTQRRIHTLDAKERTRVVVN